MGLIFFDAEGNPCDCETCMGQVPWSYTGEASEQRDAKHRLDEKSENLALRWWPEEPLVH